MYSLDCFIPSIHTTLMTNKYMYYSKLDGFQENDLIVKRSISF